MFGRIHPRRFKRGAWLALLAVWLQVLAPALHDASAMAAAGPAGFDPAHHLCVAPGSQPVDPGGPAKAPAHHQLPACALCQAVQAAGGFAPPPAAPSIAVRRTDTLAYQAPSDWPASPRESRTRQQPRAPPVLA